MHPKNIFYMFMIGAAIAQPTLAAMRVAVTNTLYREFVQQVGGEHVSVVVVKDSASDDLADYDLIFRHGLGLDPWLDAVDSPTPTVTLTDGLPLMRVGQPFHRELALPHTDISALPPCCQANAVQDNQAWAELLASLEPEETAWLSIDADAPHDPYVWLDPVHVMTLTVSINEILADYDPAHAADYDQQADHYLSQLQTLHQWIRDEVATIPVKHRILLTSNDRLRYFAKRYGFVVPLHFPAIVEQKASAQSTERLARGLSISATFIDGLHRIDLERFNQILSLPPPVMLTATLNPAGTAYASVMQQNAKKIVAALVKD